MKALFFLFLLLLSFGSLFSQVNTNACIDSSARVRFTAPVNNWAISNFKKSTTGFLFCGDVANQQNSGVVDMFLGKTDSEGELLWAKHANRIPYGEQPILYDWAEGNNNIYWLGNFDAGINKAFVVKTDTSGNAASSFYYNINYGLGNPAITPLKIKYFSDDEIYLLAHVAEYQSLSPYNFVIRFRSDGSIVWSKAFKTEKEYSGPRGVNVDLIKNADRLIVFGTFMHYSLMNQIYQRGFIKTTLNEGDGQLIQTASYAIPALDQLLANTGGMMFMKIFETDKGISLLFAANDSPLFPQFSFTSKFIKVDLDSSFDISKIIQVAPLTIDGTSRLTDVAINRHNQTCVIINKGMDFYHSFLNEQDSLIKTIKIKSSVRAIPLDYYNRLTYDNDGSISYLMSYDDIASFNRYELLKLKAGWKSSEEECMGKDTSFVALSKISCTPYNFSWLQIADNIAQRQLFNIEVNDFTLQQEMVCTEKSICETIKIKGNSKFCLPNDTATFTIYKNPLCNRKLNWAADTTAVKIISQPTDSTIHVKFLKPYAGYLKAFFEGCVLKDSLLIEISNPKQPLSLGKDTMLCRGKTITLDAGAGFKTYQWQNNSINQTFTATTPGLYFAEVTDSCGNIFRDSILIKPMDVSFTLSYPRTICQYDTAVLPVHPKLYDFTWSPSGDGLFHNNRLKFFPLTSTTFNVTATRLAGCQLTDTVLIKVENCPIYIYIPNAFTPNNDGNNDLFKPLISGRTLSYRFNIYNRYGQLIFSSTEPGKGWDGSIGGLGQNTGSFIYTCSYRFINQPEVFKKGTVLLVR